MLDETCCAYDSLLHISCPPAGDVHDRRSGAAGVDCGIEDDECVTRLARRDLIRRLYACGAVSTVA